MGVSGAGAAVFFLRTGWGRPTRAAGPSHQVWLCPRDLETALGWLCVLLPLFSLANLDLLPVLCCPPWAPGLAVGCPEPRTHVGCGSASFLNRDLLGGVSWPWGAPGPALLATGGLRAHTPSPGAVALGREPPLPGIQALESTEHLPLRSTYLPPRYFDFSGLGLGPPRQGRAVIGRGVYGVGGVEGRVSRSSTPS